MGSRACIQSVDNIHIYYPFFPSKDVDPRYVFSVADQVLCEHIFGFYSQESFGRGLTSVFFEADVDRQKMEVLLKQKFPVRRSDGQEFSQEQVCNAISAMFKGTTHAPVQNALKKLICDGSDIRVQLNYVPINISALFSTTDMSIYDPAVLPLNSKNLPPTTGPYYLVEMSADVAKLKRNRFYPAELISNTIEDVTLHWQNTGAEAFLNTADPHVQNLFYLFGFQVNRRQIDALKSKGYRVEESPSEWMAYLGFNAKTARTDRLALAHAVDEIRKEGRGGLDLGQEAFSISPADRDFGLKADEYWKIAENLAQAQLSRPVRIGLFKEYENSPILACYREGLSAKFRNKIEFVVFERASIRDIFTPQVDAYLLVLGIAPDDPLTHFSYLQEMNPLVGQTIPRHDIEDLSRTENLVEFNKKVVEFESLILQHRLLVPLAHYPGVVASARSVTRNENLAWSWGIQAWTLKIY